MRDSSIYHHLRQHVLLLEQALDPRSPRFEDAGLRNKGGGWVQLQGDGVGPIADAAAKCEIGFEAGCKISGLGRTFKAGACRGVKVAYDCEARARRYR